MEGDVLRLGARSAWGEILMQVLAPSREQSCDLGLDWVEALTRVVDSVPGGLCLLELCILLGDGRPSYGD